MADRCSCSFCCPVSWTGAKTTGSSPWSNLLLAEIGKLSVKLFEFECKLVHRLALFGHLYAHVLRWRHADHFAPKFQLIHVLDRWWIIFPMIFMIIEHFTLKIYPVELASVRRTVSTHCLSCWTKLWRVEHHRRRLEKFRI